MILTPCFLKQNSGWVRRIPQCVVKKKHAKTIFIFVDVLSGLRNEKQDKQNDQQEHRKTGIEKSPTIKC